MKSQVRQNYGLRVMNRQGASQFDPVKEFDPRMIATASAIEAVVEDPLLSVLE